MPYEIAIGDIAFDDLGTPDEARYAMYGCCGQPRHRRQESSASGYEGKEIYDHGFDGRTISIEVAYVDEDAESLMNSDLEEWAEETFTIDIDGIEYENCMLNGEPQPLEKNPGCYVVMYTFEQIRPNS